MTTGLLDQALAAHAAGLNVVPVRADGTKRPDLQEWAALQSRPVTDAEIRAWFANGRPGMGIICGAISGGLEMLEFEARAVEAGIHAEFVRAAEALGLADLLDRIVGGYLEETPSGGLHLLYRVTPAEEVEGNLKLARRQADARVDVLIETRGEGGYVVVAPSHGPTHTTGKPWVLKQGGYDRIATITAEERAQLHQLARSFDQMPAPAEPRPTTQPRQANGELRPGDDYNNRATWTEVLEPHGWQLRHQRGQTGYWRKPASNDPGHHATTDHDGNGYLYVFSTATIFEPERGYTRFAAYALLNHAGDHEAAAKELAAQGYGQRKNPLLTRIEQRAEQADIERKEQRQEDPLFRRMTAAELLSMDRTYRWLVRRMLLDPTYGQVAGEAKTLKTYIALMIWVGIASGQPVLDLFTPDEPRPVVAYVGEGGAIPFARRLERVAAAMQVDVDNLPLHLSFDVAPIPSARFRRSLERDLDQIRPAVLGLDPFYAYHGTEVKAADLHQEGGLLAAVGAMCTQAGASLLINNHFNQTGTGRSLNRITQAGSTEWVDTWLFLSHRHRPDVAQGHFHLLLDIGSRQWGGSSWDLELNVGHFDHDTSEFDGPIEWTIQRHQETDDADELVDRVVQTVADRPAELTKEELAKAVGGRLVDAREAVQRAELQRLIIPALRMRAQSDGRQRKTWVFDTPSQNRTTRDDEPPREDEHAGQR